MDELESDGLEREGVKNSILYLKVLSSEMDPAEIRLIG